MLDSIFDFRRRTTAFCYDEQKFVNNGRTYMRTFTADWQLFCQWKDGSKSWKKSANLKESQPTETAEYAIYQNLQGGAAFNW